MSRQLFRGTHLTAMAAVFLTSALTQAQATPPVSTAPAAAASTSETTPVTPAPATQAPITPAPSPSAAGTPEPAPRAATTPEPTAPEAPAAQAPAAQAPAAQAPTTQAPVTSAASASPTLAAPAARTETRSERKLRLRNAARSRAQRPVPEEQPRYPLYSFLTLQAVANSVWNTDVGYDVFHDKDVAGRFGVQLDADLVHLIPSLALAAELGYTYEATDDGELPVGLGDAANLEAHHPHVAALLRWALLDWVSLHARAQAGLSFTKLSIERGTETLSKQATSPFFVLGGGFSLATPAHRISGARQYFNSLSYGARVEVGYVFSDSIAMRFPNSPANPPQTQLAVRGAELGSLKRSGALLGLSAFVRF